MFKNFQANHLNTLENVTVPLRVQGTRVNRPNVFREHICFVQACSENTMEWFPSVFSETFADYEAFLIDEF
jgi:hypothetical protein